MTLRASTSQIIVHGSYTPPTMDAGVEDIRDWHMARGWSDIGYHYVIRRDGTLELGRPSKLIGAHAHGANRDSLGICLVGGMPAEGTPQRALPAHLAWDCNYTRPQWAALAELVDSLLSEWPGVGLGSVIGHRDVPGTTKQCPGFDVAAWVAGWTKH